MKARNLLLLVISLLPSAAWACKPVYGYEYKIPSEMERIAEADVVFIASSVAVKDAPEMQEISHHPYTYRVTMDVERWVKGSGNRAQIVFDTGGTDCDFLSGISHIANLIHANNGAFLGRVFARRSHGQLWVITAELLK